MTGVFRIPIPLGQTTPIQNRATRCSARWRNPNPLPCIPGRQRALADRRPADPGRVADLWKPEGPDNPWAQLSSSLPRPVTHLPPPMRHDSEPAAYCTPPVEASESAPLGGLSLRRIDRPERQDTSRTAAAYQSGPRATRSALPDQRTTFKTEEARYRFSPLLQTQNRIVGCLRTERRFTAGIYHPRTAFIINSGR